MERPLLGDLGFLSLVWPTSQCTSGPRSCTGTGILRLIGRAKSEALSLPVNVPRARYETCRKLPENFLVPRSPGLRPASKSPSRSWFFSGFELFPTLPRMTFTPDRGMLTCLTSDNTFHTSAGNSFVRADFCPDLGDELSASGRSLHLPFPCSLTQASPAFVLFGVSSSASLCLFSGS